MWNYLNSLFTWGYLLFIVAVGIQVMAMNSLGQSVDSWVNWADFLAVLLAFWAGRMDQAESAAKKTT